jgi:aspartate aminotransferase-like enzyme
MYLDVRLLLENGERGQTPFTPAVQTLLQINARLRQIDAKGVDAETSRISALAADFRTRAAGLPFDMRLDSPSNAVTYCETRGWSARELFSRLKDEYGIWVCPNGGPAADSSFRVGHLGNLTMRDNSLLLAAMRDLRARGLMGGE